MRQRPARMPLRRAPSYLLWTIKRFSGAPARGFPSCPGAAITCSKVLTKPPNLPPISPGWALPIWEATLPCIPTMYRPRMRRGMSPPRCRPTSLERPARSPTAAWSPRTMPPVTISLNHLCSGLRFMVNRNDIKAVTIRGNSGEKFAGDFRFRFTSEDTPVVEAGTEECVTLTPSSGSTFEAGTLYYIIILPTVFTKGFTLTAEGGSQVGELRFASSVTFTAGQFKNVTGHLNERMTWTTPPSQVYYGHENSFSLRPGNTISFDVNPRKIYGTWQRSGLPASASFPDEAEVLWGGGAISSASVNDGKLIVTASETPGSALVAIKDKYNTILWSYLIWVTESAPAETTLPGGARVLPPLGGNCYFQWGRKDPLLSSADRVTDSGSGSLAFSILHPAEYINRNSNYDWIADVDWTLWGDDAAKTVWDPCPAGYRVPAKDDFSGITESFLTGNFEALGYIADNGYKNYTDYCYWTRSTAIQGTERKLSWCLSWYPGTSEADILLKDYRYMAYPVRCVKE